MGQVHLAGDIGGTKTHLALFEKGEERTWLVDQKFKSGDYDDLRTIVKEFLGSHRGYRPEKACFGIAGPVRDRVCRATNLPWIVDAKLIEEVTGIPRVDLINDLEANAYGIHCLKGDELFVLNEGKQSAGNAALISAGTGLGEAGLFWDGKKHIPFACEGGHCAFAPESLVETKLLKYLMKKYDHVSFERVLSGPGIYQLYRFLIDEGIEEEGSKIDSPQAVTEHALKGDCFACVHAIELFVSIYGNEAANMALKMLATGGVFIGGGIAPKLLNAMKEGSFISRFIHKGRFTSLLQDVPVKVILNENTAMLGAAYYAGNC